MKSKTYNNGEVRSSEKDFETLQLGAFATPGLLLAQRLCRNARMAHTCHLERSERSCIFSYMRRKDFSPLARNDNCDTVSQGGGLIDSERVRSLIASVRSQRFRRKIQCQRW